MNRITDEDAVLVSSRKGVYAEVVRLAKELEKKLPSGREVLFIPVLKGGFVFAADLIREIERPRFRVEFVQARSYRGTKRSGDLSLSGLDRIDFRGEYVLLVDDIYDSGETIEELKDRIEAKGAEEVISCVLAKREGADPGPDCYGFEVQEGEFLIGYGMDLSENYRGLPGIVKVEKKLETKGRVR